MATLRTLHVGRSEQRGPLTVFPIWHERTEGSAVDLAARGTLQVGVLLTPSVPHLQVTVREAAGRPDRATTGYRTRGFVGVVETMELRTKPDVGVGRSTYGEAGQLELLGLADGARLLHASGINHAAINHAASASAVAK